MSENRSKGNRRNRWRCTVRWRWRDRDRGSGREIEVEKIGTRETKRSKEIRGISFLFNLLLFQQCSMWTKMNTVEGW